MALIEEEGPSPEEPGVGRSRWTRRAVLAALLGVPATGAAWAAEQAINGGQHPTHRTSRSAGEPGHSAAAGSGRRRTTIAEESAKTGSDDWDVDHLSPAAWDKLRGFADRTSVQQGEPFRLFVSTAAPEVTVTAYRMGYYRDGKGGRVVWRSPPLPGRRQPPARIDPLTGMRDAPWSPTLTVTPDHEWVPGQYLLKLESDDGGQSQVPMVIRDDAYPAPVHIQQDVTTWQAYNRWGGANLYEGDHGRADVVSFDRPYVGTGQGNFLRGVYEIGALVESLGLEVTYSTSLDTHLRPDLVKQHKVWISPAHDEYWSKEMRDGVQAARDGGVNLMFLGANCMFRRIRLENSELGPSRHVVNYRVARRDPFNGKDPERVTTSWREPPAARPESDITGTYYESNPVDADMVVVAADAWMFQGTGVANGDRWPHVVGNEYDRVTPEVPTPPTIQVLAHSPVRIKGRNSWADMTYYTVPSGAAVFSAGSIWFERQLHPHARGFQAQIAGMVTNILKAFARGPAAAAHPSRPNLRELGIHTGYVTGIK